MRAVLLAPLVLAFPLEGLFGGGDTATPGPGKVVELSSDSEVDKFLSDNAISTVLFYAPWCYFCAKAVPEWSRTAVAMKEAEPFVAFGKANVMKLSEPSIGKYGIEAFPHFTLSVDGTMHVYRARGPASQPALTQWLKDAFNHDHVLEDDHAVEVFSHDFLEKNTRVVLGIVGKGTPEHDSFVKLSRHFDDVLFAEVDTSERARKFVDSWIAVKHESPDTVKVVDKDLQASGLLILTHHTGYERFQGSMLDMDKMNLFISLYSQPVLQNVDQYNFLQDQTDTRSEKSAPALMLYFHKRGEEPKKDHFFVQAATNLRKGLTPIHAVTIEATNSGGGRGQTRGQQIAGKMGISLSNTQIPTIRIVEVKPDKMVKYKAVVEPRSVAEVEKLAQQWEAKQLEPYLRSLPVADPGPSGQLLEVVADNFVEKVINADRDVFVNCFAPWCGHCQNLKPKWQELQRAVKFVASLDVPFFDATQNELPVATFRVSGYPTLVLFPAGKKASAVEYQGNRGVPDFLAFLHRHATKPFDEKARPKTTVIEEDDDPLGVDL